MSVHSYELLSNLIIAKLLFKCFGDLGEIGRNLQWKSPFRQK
jgi:hypothetical protein